MTLLLATFALAAPAFVDQGFVLRPPETGAFAGGINAPTIDIDDATSTYVMYFESAIDPVSTDCINSYSIGRATSSDGLNWSLDSAPVLSPNPDNDNSRCVVSQPSVVFDGTRWHLFYSTAREKPSSDADYNLPTGITYATSEDGTNFTIQAEPLIAATDLSETIGLSSATIVNSVLYVVYYYNRDFRLATADLLDTSAWSTPTDTLLDHATLEFASTQLISPALFCEDDTPEPFSLVFAGDAADTDGANTRSLALATSPDGLGWTLDDETPLTGGDLTYSDLNHWDVIEAGPDYLLWYSKTDPDSGLKAVGLASTSTPWSPARPRLCPHEFQTNPPDLNPGDDTGGDTNIGDTDGGGADKDGGCNCSASGTSAAFGGVVLALALVRRRR